ncbi:MAG: SDR family NAD(P)-dependent oxidoreductase [Candidatus Hydrogenedentes bacterium]|nr:SDR family NAD(P)-dependent oxidoreductase [Candidatus Hydrogenedentota bacterium]
MNTGNAKSYFITGCASGIAQHVTDRLVKQGARVYATDVNMEALARHANEAAWPEDRVKLDTLDVRKLEAWEEVFARAASAFGTIDVCMNIAGVMVGGWIQDQPAKEIDMQIDVNLKGVIWGTQVAARHMVPLKRGHIVNIASLAGIAPIPGIAVYVASKHGVRGFTLAIANELRQYGIDTTVVCPDAIRTPLVEQCARIDAGAMVFSGPRLLSLNEIGDVIMTRVLQNRELEVAVPWSRAWLSRISAMFPGLGGNILPGLIKKGKQHQVEHLHGGEGSKSPAEQH